MGTIKRKRERDPWAPPLRLQTVRAKLVSRPIPARMAQAQWQVFDSSKDETHCSSPERPSSTSFHGVVGRPAGSPDICESPPRQPDQVCRSASNQSVSTHPGNLGGRVHKVLGRHRRLPAGYSGPRGCCVPTRAGRVARQGRVVETLVRLIRFEFTGYLPNREWTAYRGSPGRGAGPTRRGRQCLSRTGNRPRSSTPCQVDCDIDTPQGSRKAGRAGVGAGLRTGLSC